MLELSPRSRAGMGRKSCCGFWLQLVQVGCSGPCPAPPGMVVVPRTFQAALGCLMHHLSGFFSLPRTLFGIGRKLQAPEVILFHLTEHKSASELPFGLILIQDLPLPQNPPRGGELTG